MRMEWSRTKAGEDRAFSRSTTYALVLISLMATLGIQGFRYMRSGRPLERHYLPAYLGPLMAGLLADNSAYTLLQVVTTEGSRVGHWDSYVVHPRCRTAERIAFALTEEAVKHGPAAS